jgi:endonuclease YncB( thermonuclease family)
MREAVTRACSAPRTNFVVCYADTPTPQGLQRVELGTALIASGFAFVARTQEGRPVNFPYLVAEQEAKAARAGLWAFPDTPNPTPSCSTP